MFMLNSKGKLSVLGNFFVFGLSKVVRFGKP